MKWIIDGYNSINLDNVSAVQVIGKANNVKIRFQFLGSESDYLLGLFSSHDAAYWHWRKALDVLETEQVLIWANIKLEEFENKEMF